MENNKITFKLSPSSLNLMKEYPSKGCEWCEGRIIENNKY